MTNKPDIHSEMIYETQHCVSIQDDINNLFYVHFFGIELQLKPCALFSLKNKLEKINLEDLLLDEQHPGLEIIKLGCSDRIFALTLSEIIELKDLIDGTMTLLELNSVIHSRLVRV